MWAFLMAIRCRERHRVMWETVTAQNKLSLMEQYLLRERLASHLWANMFAISVSSFWKHLLRVSDGGF